MNKLLIVLLAICLVSVHAFVKRDAPVTEKDYLKDIGEKIKEAGAAVEKVFQPDQLKKQFDEAMETVKKAFAPKDDKAQ